MGNFRLTIEYDGTEFSGWQVQPDRRTVQGELYRALGDLAKGDFTIVGAGRTDAGVHAVGQVASVDLTTAHDAPVLKRALQAKLPGDILVRSVEEAPASFNARFDALSRTYHYIFLRRATALWRNRFLAVARDLDIQIMRAAAARVTGERDFTAFTSKSDTDGPLVSRVIESTVFESGPFVVYRIRADRFLYNMVRRIAGTLLAAGRGERPDIEGMIESGDRSRSSAPLPPSALYLMSVEYGKLPKIG